MTVIHCNICINYSASKNNPIFQITFKIVGFILLDINIFLHPNISILDLLTLPSKILKNYNRLAPFYSYPDQLVFVDETSKDGRHSIRKFARSLKGTPAIVNLPTTRGKRVSVLAAMTTTGFKGYVTTEGTYDRQKFHEGFHQAILPCLNPWPLPNSIVIMDNAKIHMYPELADLIHSAGALLFYLPPYCPHLNPIEIGFGQLKKWIQKHANLAF